MLNEDMIEAGLDCAHHVGLMAERGEIEAIYLAMKSKEQELSAPDVLRRLDGVIHDLGVLNLDTEWPLLSRELMQIRAALTAVAPDNGRLADLTLALDLACRTLGDMEPPDSRATSNEFVALFSILCDKANDECREIIKAAIAEHEARAALTAVTPDNGLVEAWQPIETAPKDGTPIIGVHWGPQSYERKGNIARVWWQPEFDGFISSCREMQMHGGYQFGDGSTRKLHSPVIEEVTHWMPFHEPVRIALGGEGDD